MLGAPGGGTTRGGHQGVDCAAFRSIITVADTDGEKAALLQNFALAERAVDEP